MGIKQLAKSTANRFGIRLAKDAELPDRSEIGLLELSIRALFPTNQAITFCQVGANDCSSNDPFQALIQPNWRGLLIEPQPAPFGRLKEKYGANNNIALRQCVVAPQRGEMDLYYVNNLEGLLDVMEGVASLSKAHVEKFLRGSRAGMDRMSVMKVPAVPLMDLLSETSLLPLDLLVIDVEGFDDHVVKMVDLKRVRPAVIYYEHNNLTLERDTACMEYLQANDYRLARAPIDTLAIDSKHLKWKR